MPIAGSAAAPLSIEVARFFSSIGLRISQGYGLTETGGAIVMDREGKARPGSVGFPLAGISVQIAEDGEILIQGPTNTPGYLNLPEANDDLYFPEQWLRTGDIGYLNEEGMLFITDRKKDIIINSSGKNISPTTIEGHVVGRSFISQALVCGESKPYVTALVTLNVDQLRQFSSSIGLAGDKPQDVVNHPAVIAEVQRVVDEANASLSRPEQIKKFSILPEEWSVEKEEMTPTFKLRRKVIYTKYSDVIDSLYS